MTTATGVTAVGTTAGIIGDVTIGVESSGVESRPAEKRNAIVIGSAIMIERCVIVTKMIAVTIVDKHGSLKYLA
jgi:hypothetical protein